MKKEKEEFPDNVIEKLGYYVYALIDPREESYGVFYIGKGKGNRVFDHVKEARKYVSTDAKGKKAEQQREVAYKDKYKIIKEIEASNHHVEYYLLRHGITCEEMAYQIESTLIDTFTHLDLFAKIDKEDNKSILSNIVSGHDQAQRGIKTIDEIKDYYNAKDVDLLPYMRRKKNFVAIKLSENYDAKTKDETIYERVHFCWKVNENRIQKIHYVLAISNGIIRGIYPCHNNAWKKVQEGQKIVEQDEGRYYFDKQEPENSQEFEKLKEDLLNNKLVGLHHSQNPVAYFDQIKLKEIEKGE